MAQRFDNSSQSVLNAFAEPEPAPVLRDLPAEYEPTTAAPEPVAPMKVEPTGNCPWAADPTRSSPTRCSPRPGSCEQEGAP